MPYPNQGEGTEADLCRCQTVLVSGEHCANVPSYVVRNKVPHEDGTYSETSMCQACLDRRSESERLEAYRTVSFTMIEPQYEVLIWIDGGHDRIVGTLDEVADEIARIRSELPDDARVRLQVPASPDKRKILACLVSERSVGLEVKNRAKSVCMIAERRADKALDLLSVCDDPVLRLRLQQYADAMTAQAHEARSVVERGA